MTRKTYGCVLPVLLFVLSAFGGHAAFADGTEAEITVFKAVAANPKVVANHKLWLTARGGRCGLLDRGLYPVDVPLAKACLRKRYEEQLAELKKANAP